MNRSELTRFQTWSILLGAAVMLSLAMGMRQSLGLFQPQMIRDGGVNAAQFSFAIATQNIVWGLTQPFAGMLADRWGTRPVALTGVVIYALGLSLAVICLSPWLLTLGLDRRSAFLHGVEHRDGHNVAHRHAGAAQRRDGRGVGRLARAPCL
jgi:sugar phosphate permease